MYLENKTRFMPIGVSKDTSINIQGSKFTENFEVLELAKEDNFPPLLGKPWCYTNNVYETNVKKIVPSHDLR